MKSGKISLRQVTYHINQRGDTYKLKPKDQQQKLVRAALKKSEILLIQARKATQDGEILKAISIIEKAHKCFLRLPKEIKEHPEGQHQATIILGYELALNDMRANLYNELHI